MSRLRKNTEYSLDVILSRIDAPLKLVGLTQNIGKSFSSVFDDQDSSISWIRATGNAAKDLVKKSKCSILICQSFEHEEIEFGNKSLIFVDNPQLVFFRLVNSFFYETYRSSAGIHPTALVSPNATIGKNVSIGPFTILGNCEIGNDSEIRAFSKIHDDVTIGKRVLISEHCNIGGEGFGYIKNSHGHAENITHIGGTSIGDDVAIFPYTNIDRGTLGYTRVRAGTKIDHYCHIGHNSTIGSHSILTPNVVVLGGAKIGSHCWIGCGTKIKDGLTVGDNAITGMDSTVTKDVPKNETWVGSPAQPFEQFKIMQSKLRRL